MRIHGKNFHPPAQMRGMSLPQIEAKEAKESAARRWRIKYPAFGKRCDQIIAEHYRQNADDLELRAGEPRSRPYFFRGKPIGEQVTHDDRALMFLLKLEDGQRAHEIRLR